MTYLPVILRGECPEESKRCFAYAQHDGKKEILRCAQDDREGSAQDDRVVNAQDDRFYCLAKGGGWLLMLLLCGQK